MGTPKKDSTEVFSSRWALVLAALGMAIGTGNIWRFPRVAAENGGGAFLIPWILFLFLWSIPLLMVELSMGRHARLGVIGAFGQIMGRRFLFLGGFVAFCTTAILFYYSVVTGWALRYAVGSITGEVARAGGRDFWKGLQSSPESVLFHAIAIFGTAWIVGRGIVGGIERANRLLIPSLFVLLAIMAARVVTLPGAGNALGFLFEPDFAKLGDHRVWLDALSQSAWSTGAGWGLILTYAVYSRRREDIPVNAFLCGLGNNSASLLAGIVIVGAVFSLAPSLAAAGDGAMTPEEILAAGNEGLAFVWIPNLLLEMPGGRVFLPVFFIALSVAAVSSLIAMVELATRVLMDFGLRRKTAIAAVAGAAFLCGIPSALSTKVFRNQDWVWGLGLMVSGAFFALAAIRFGVERVRVRLLNAEGTDLPIGSWFTLVVTFLVPLEFLAMIVWWFVKAARDYEPGRWADPFRTFSIGTCLVQWGLVLVAFGLANRWMGRRLLGEGSS